MPAQHRVAYFKCAGGRGGSSPGALGIEAAHAYAGYKLKRLEVVTSIVIGCDMPCLHTSLHCLVLPS
jgi:hypothetical protein